MKTKNSPSLLLALVSLAAPAMAPAANLSFDNSVTSTVTVTAGDFESGLYLNGSASPLQQGYNSASSSLSPGNTPISFSGTWIELGQSGTGTNTLYVVIPGTSNVVNIFSYQWATGGFQSTVSGTFTSGSLGTVPDGVNPSNVYPANGTPIGWSLPFLGGEIRVADLTVVPEPAGPAMLAAGLLALGMARRRK